MPALGVHQDGIDEFRVTLSERRLVLPAFGSLTGGFNIRDTSFAELMGGEFFAHMLGGEQIFSFPAANCLPD
jgi:metallophosphoesterase superfamily enzyme